jgi:hypothetical protein
MKRNVLVAIVMLAGLAGCQRESAPEAARAPVPVPTDQQVIDAATVLERKYQDALAKGELDFLAECGPGSAESMRLVEMAADDAQGYSLAVIADARGAVAIWQGIQHLGEGKYQAYGPKGMRLDVNGWRQLRQSLSESSFVDGEKVVDGDGLFLAPTRSFLVFCLEGERGMASATTASAEFDRIAVRMRRLAGNYYSPPAPADAQ